MLLMDGCFRVGPWGPSVYEDIISLSRVKAKGLYCLSEFLNTGRKKNTFFVASSFLIFLFYCVYRCEDARDISRQSNSSAQCFS